MNALASINVFELQKVKGVNAPPKVVFDHGRLDKPGNWKRWMRVRIHKEAIWGGWRTYCSPTRKGRGAPTTDKAASSVRT